MNEELFEKNVEIFILCQMVTGKFSPYRFQSLDGFNGLSCFPIFSGVMNPQRNQYDAGLLKY